MKRTENFRSRERWLAIKGEVACDGYKFRVSFHRQKGNEVVNQHYDFTSHPLRHLLKRFIVDGVEGENAGTLNGKCRGLKALGEFLNEKGERDLNPEIFSLYARWLFEVEKSDGKGKLSESSIAPRLYLPLSLYKFGLVIGQPNWNQRDLDLMTATATNASRGRIKRGVQLSVDKALSLDTYAALAKALTLEFDQCRKILDARNLGQRQSLYNPGQNTMRTIDPNPFVVFALQCAMRLGLRATELNSLRRQDIHVDNVYGNHELYVHAPDKSDDFIPIDETFLRSLRVCEEWDKEARESAGAAGEEYLRDALLVYRPTSSCYGYPFFQLSTYYLNSSHLKYFCQKWFDFKIKTSDGTELPLLHADDDPTKRLQINYRSLRNSFAIRFAERERSRTTLKRVMRHKSIVTTEKYYLHLTKLEHAKKVQIALKAEAQMLVLGLNNAIGAGITEETLSKAKEAGAITPHGICASALDGHGCYRANDCLECPHLVVITTRRPRFVADRDEYVQMAEELHSNGDIRGSENALARAKICQAQIIRIDETFN